MNLPQNDNIDARFTHQIRQALNESAYQIPADKAAKLRAARAQALAVQKRPSPALQFLGSALGLSQAAQRSQLSNLFMLGLPAVALAAGLWVLSDTQADQVAEQLAKVDTQVLTSEVPLNALLDKGFVHYVQHGE